MPTSIVGADKPTDLGLWLRHLAASYKPPPVGEITPLIDAAIAARERTADDVFGRIPELRSPLELLCGLRSALPEADVEAGLAAAAQRIALLKGLGALAGRNVAGRVPAMMDWVRSPEGGGKLDLTFAERNSQDGRHMTLADDAGPRVCYSVSGWRWRARSNIT